VFCELLKDWRKIIARKKLPVILELEEAQNLLRQPNKRYPTGLRNKAMMSLMFHCALRISEVIKFKNRQY